MARSSKRVILYLPDSKIPFTACSVSAVHALGEGLVNEGLDCEIREPANFKDVVDTAIVCGWRKQRIKRLDKLSRNHIIEAQEEAGKPAWCLERGFIGRRKEWSSLSIGGSISSGGIFKTSNMPSDRWKKLAAPLEPWKQGSRILLCGQVPWDAQLESCNYFEWLRDTVVTIRQYTDMPIVFRPHPNAFVVNDPYARLLDEFNSIVEPWSNMAIAVPFEQELARSYHAVVCYNSNTAILSLIHGTPVFTGADSGADPIACRDLSQINNPPKPDRRQWAYDLAYKQWNMEELRRALPWKHLTRDL